MRRYAWSRAPVAMLLLSAAVLIPWQGAGAQGAATLVGVVRDTSGAPVDSVSVAPRAASGLAPLGATTDSKGRFVIAATDSGQFYVSFQKPGYHAMEYRWSPAVPSRTEVNVVLVPIGQQLDPAVVTAAEARRLAGHASLLGLVVDEDGHPVEGASVQLIGADRSVTTGADGAYAFRLLAARPYTLRIRKIGYEPAMVSLTLEESAERRFGVQINRLPTGLQAAVVTARSGFGSGQVAFEELQERLRWRSFANWTLSRDDLRYQEGAPLDLVAHDLGVTYVEDIRKRRNLTKRGITSINMGPLGVVSHPIDSEVPAHMVEGDACMLINGIRQEYGPLRAYAARDIEFLEIYPPGTEVTSTVAPHMHGPCAAVSMFQHPTYYVLWLK